MKVIEKHSSMGWVGLFGLPFFLAGCFFIYAGFDPSTKWDGDRPSLYFLIPFCSIFIAVGGILMIGRWGYHFDMLKRQGYTYWGLLIPLLYKRFNFDEVDYVLIDSEVRQNKNSSYTVYVIKLLLKNKKIIKIENNLSNYLFARERGEKIARECRLRLLNKKEENRILEYREVDKSLMDKIKLGVEKPQSPANTSISFSTNLQDLEITSNHEVNWLPQMVPVIFALVFYVPFEIVMIYVTRNINDSVTRLGILAFMSVPMILIFFKQVLTRSRGFKIEINREQINYINFTPLKKQVSIPIREIDEITMLENNSLRPRNMIGLKMFKISKYGIYILSGEKVVVLDPIKSKEDEKYLCDLLKYCLFKKL